MSTIGFPPRTSDEWDVPAARPRVRLYTTVDHRVWVLTSDFVDSFDRHWHWDGADFDAVAGPEMVADDNPLLHLPLIGLAMRCGLHSDTSTEVAGGALITQHHDQIEAGLTGGAR
ncbi:hypothetical protein [Streptomyces sp. NPDC059165]|uniref:hypothetical protein n=1 Tax=Streptomyces sp. NPDC059165 TaxID=3346751 RepID=UPI0036A07449